MINYLTPKFKILVLSILLVAVAFFPVMVTNYSDKKELNTLNVSDFVAKNNEIHSYDAATHDILERLEIISNAGTKETGVITEQGYEFTSMANIKNVKKIIENEIIIMQNKEVIPKFDISDFQIQYIVKVDFADQAMQNRKVSALQVQASCTMYEFYVSLDMETNKIYEISFVSTKENNQIDFTESSFEKFLNYIGIPIQQTEYIVSLKEPEELYKIYNLQNDNPIATYAYVENTNYLGIMLRFYESMQ